ncbi:hypothetical protein [Streptomyces rimosus]|uniref:hypothetical protein n=1 Tax=Streptomyces rimosus TaxID=1927 RepID=UPI0007C4BEE3|nr:hypothetical protein [Streptomyces rimosus]
MAYDRAPAAGRTGHGPGPGSAEDRVFGRIGLDLDAAAGRLTVHGERVPTAELRRAPEAVPARSLPFGTRDATALRLTVDGHPGHITPGGGRLARRSHRVDVIYGGILYRLLPDSPGGSRLVKDGRRIADFSSDGAGHVWADWHPDVAPPLREDAAVGYVLATAFGTGAEPSWRLLVQAVAGMLR